MHTPLKQNHLATHHKAKTVTFFGRWLSRITVLSLMAVVFFLVFGWWNDRQQTNKKLCTFASEHGRLESVLHSLTVSEKSLKQTLTVEQDIRKYIHLLDPSDTEHQAAIRILSGLSSTLVQDSGFGIVQQHISRFSFSPNSETNLETVIAHTSLLANPGCENTVVLLIERMPRDEVSPGYTEPRIVDCLVRQTSHNMFGTRHSVSYSEKDGDKPPEVIFEFQDNNQKRHEIFEPTFNGLAMRDSGSKRPLR